MDVEIVKEKRSELELTIRRLLINFRSETGTRPEVVVDWPEYRTIAGGQVSVPPTVTVELKL
jgi:hypothetical protein